MSTIAYDGVEIVSDLAMNGAYTRKCPPKIRLAQDWVLVGCGRPAEFQRFVEWWPSREDKAFPSFPAESESQFCAISKREPSTIRYFHALSKGYWLAERTPFAMGTGAKFAIGAMDAGATPTDAVLIASDRDPYSGVGLLRFSIAEWAFV